MSYSFKSLAENGVYIHGHDGMDEKGNPTGGYAQDSDLLALGDARFLIRWQDGPVNRAEGETPNGAFVEDVLEVCKRRMDHYERTGLACDENRLAIFHIKSALTALMSRRHDRRARGVQGMNVK